MAEVPNSQKENRKSQQRKQKARQDGLGEGGSPSQSQGAESPTKEADISSIYLQEMHGSPQEEKSGSTTAQASNSPGKQPCPKSPLKRMKTLEQQENIRDQENIETTYKKSPERAVTLTLQPTEVQADAEAEPADDIVALNPEEPTTLL